MTSLRNELQLILQARAPDRRFSCEGFVGIPVVFPALIVIDAATGQDEQCRQLTDAIRRTLVDLTPQSRLHHVPCSGNIPSPFSCHAIQVTLCQKMLVLVGDAGGNFPEELLDDWLTGGDTYHVLPVFPAETDLSTLRSRHPHLAQLNAAFYRNSLDEVVPTVLATAGITSEEFRVFISYKRLDALPLANQLFGALTEAGFDVFLDRFSIEPGVNFQARLTQELADKSLVLLLESKHVGKSEWTQVEIAFAKKHELGLVSILLPSGQPQPDVDPAARIEFNDPTNWVNGGPELQQHALEQVVLRVKEEHGKAMVRRRDRVRDSMRGALALRKVPVWLGPDGLLECVAHGKRFALWLTPRPPDLRDFHFAHSRVEPPHAIPGATPRKGVVVGPTAMLETLRMARTNWLADRCRFLCFDEAEITRVADDIARGAL